MSVPVVINNIYRSAVPAPPRSGTITTLRVKRSGVLSGIQGQSPRWSWGKIEKPSRGTGFATTRAVSAQIEGFSATVE